MIYAIVGSRDFNNLAYLSGVMDNFEDVDTVVSGGARGADKLGAEWANSRGIPCTEYLPDWSKGKGAGLERNKLIVAASDVIVAFWDGQSRGTAHTISLAKAAGKPVHVFWSE